MKPKRPFIRITAVPLAFLFLGTLAPAATITIDVLTTFDYPGTGNLTRPQKINDAGEIAGEFVDSSGVERGFVRFRNGSFSAPIAEPDDNGVFTDVRGINNSDTVCGYFVDPVNINHGFFLSGHTYTQFDVPDASNTYIDAINNAGDFCGRIVDNTGIHGYVSISSVITVFDIPAEPGPVDTFGLNNANQLVGDYYDASSIFHGYFRAADGTLTYPIDPPGSTGTTLFGINDRGWMVGRYSDSAGATHALFYQTLTRFVVFDYPGSTFTSFNGINRQGLICGRYLDSSGIEHGILARVRRMQAE